ncbi:MAG: zinc-binding alcohol dehydrogenase [Armatimonadota bacterium]|jgi:threonine dehydrogenase-like Zn-dependent dehydrogenase
MAKKRKIAAVMGNGHIGLVEEDVPTVRPGTVLLEVWNSLVSPGTEVGGWRGLKRQLEKPSQNPKPRPFGYSNAGVVIEVGDGVTEFKAGDRIAAVGGGYAMHTDYALVPHNLCVALPAGVSFAQGSYAMLTATAMHALRRGEPQFGEFVAVVGLGLVGQLAARLHQLAGGYVIGWDMIPFRSKVAKGWGIDAVAVVGAEDEVAITNDFTCGYGLDGAVFAFGGDGTRALESVRKCLKCTSDGHRMGRIVVVGGANFDYKFGLTNADLREASRTGPGYHDEEWEVGPAYPPTVMRWTTRTNLELCMRLMSEGKVNVDCLTTHTIPLADVDARIAEILKDPDAILGVVFEMKR